MPVVVEEEDARRIGAPPRLALLDAGHHARDVRSRLRPHRRTGGRIDNQMAFHRQAGVADMRDPHRVQHRPRRAAVGHVLHQRQVGNLALVQPRGENPPGIRRPQHARRQRDAAPRQRHRRQVRVRRFRVGVVRRAVERQLPLRARGQVAHPQIIAAAKRGALAVWRACLAGSTRRCGLSERGRIGRRRRLPGLGVHNHDGDAIGGLAPVPEAAAIDPVRADLRIVDLRPHARRRQEAFGAGAQFFRQHRFNSPSGKRKGAPATPEPLRSGRVQPDQLLLLRLPSSCSSSMNRLMKFRNSCRLS